VIDVALMYEPILEIVKPKVYEILDFLGAGNVINIRTLIKLFPSSVTYKRIYELYDLGLVDVRDDYIAIDGRIHRRVKLVRITEKGKKVLKLLKEINELLREV